MTIAPTVGPSLPSRGMRVLVLIALALAGSPESPAADAPLPRGTGAFADALASTTRDLEARIRGWQRQHPPAGGKPPERVTLDGLYQQRIYRYLRAHPSLASRVIAAMPAGLRRQARDNVAAG